MLPTFIYLHFVTVLYVNVLIVASLNVLQSLPYSFSKHFPRFHNFAYSLANPVEIHVAIDLLRTSELPQHHGTSRDAFLRDATLKLLVAVTLDQLFVEARFLVHAHVTRVALVPVETI